MLPSEKKEKTNTDHELEIVDAIFDSYKDYKSDDLRSCINRIEYLGFSVSKKTNDVIPKGIKIDTLYFEDTVAFNYIFVRTVDLGYLKTITGSVTLKCENTEYVVDKFVERLTESNILATVDFSKAENKYTVHDNLSFVVFDDRWKEEVTSEFPYFYTCHITVLGEIIDISFEEIVPRKYVILNQDLISENIAINPGLF
jgi:hypothetical protein